MAPPLRRTDRSAVPSPAHPGIAALGNVAAGLSAAAAGYAIRYADRLEQAQAAHRRHPMTSFERSWFRLYDVAVGLRLGHVNAARLATELMTGCRPGPPVLVRRLRPTNLAPTPVVA